MTWQLNQRAKELDWYHTLELPDGYVTPGFFDLRNVARRVPIPRSLAGQRCLDLGASDGFWSFEMAKRGAAEVVSVDLDDAARQDWQGPPSADPKRVAGTGRAREAFEAARTLYDLENVTRVDLSLYDVSPAELGTFDFVFIGNVLMHLADPARALRAARTVTTGLLLSFEGISLPLSVLRPIAPCAQLWDLDEPRWWTTNMAGHRRLVEAGGFGVLRSGGPIFQPLGDFIPRWPASIPTRPRHIAFWLFVRRFGCASQWVQAAPR
ncbi:MAG TPA: class I SAM-dependent methyltransferase [Acidimicrobiales bacterium]|nr:class I SAM-dependent methyltransferase [Acidimicrobiales bacterium]